MKKEGEGQGSYVFRVREDTRRYVQDLLNENDRLRRLVAGLESDKGRLLSEKMTLQEKVLALREGYDTADLLKALSHALSYGALARRIPESGGEYTYLSRDH